MEEEKTAAKLQAIQRGRTQRLKGPKIKAEVPPALVVTGPERAKAASHRSEEPKLGRATEEAPRRSTARRSGPRDLRATSECVQPELLS